VYNVPGRWFDGYLEVMMEKLTIPASFTAVFLEVAEGYIGFVEELPGANTQGATLEEARAGLQEAVLLVLEANRAIAEQSVQGQVVLRETLVLQAA